MQKTEVINLIKTIEEEYSKIYYELVDSKEISIYKESLLISKTSLLTKKYEKIIYNSIDNDKIIKNKFQKNSIFMLILLIIEIGLIFTFPYAALIPIILRFYLRYKNYKLRKEFLTIEDLEKIQSIAYEIDSVVNNIETFLKVKSNNRIERQKKERLENVDVLKINVANSWLQTLLSNDFDENTIILMPKEIEEIIIKMLQEDLFVEENDLKKLLLIANERINCEKQKIGDELKLVR